MKTQQTQVYYWEIGPENSDDRDSQTFSTENLSTFEENNENINSQHKNENVTLFFKIIYGKWKVNETNQQITIHGMPIYRVLHKSYPKNQQTSKQPQIYRNKSTNITNKHQNKYNKQKAKYTLKAGNEMETLVFDWCHQTTQTDILLPPFKQLYKAGKTPCIMNQHTGFGCTNTNKSQTQNHFKTNVIVPIEIMQALEN